MGKIKEGNVEMERVTLDGHQGLERWEEEPRTAWTVVFVLEAVLSLPAMVAGIIGVMLLFPVRHRDNPDIQFALHAMEILAVVGFVGLVFFVVAAVLSRSRSGARLSGLFNSLVTGVASLPMVLFVIIGLVIDLSRGEKGPLPVIVTAVIIAILFCLVSVLGMASSRGRTRGKVIIANVFGFLGMGLITVAWAITWLAAMYT